jgi:hypothetical protein
MSDQPVLGGQNLSAPAYVRITVTATGYVCASVSYPAVNGEKWRRGADGPDGSGKRGFDMAVRFAELFRESPDADPYELRDRVFGEFGDLNFGEKLN